MKITPVNLLKSIFAVVVGSFILSACLKTIRPKDQIQRIEIATSGCLKGCPVIGIQIDSLLTFRYYGGYKAKLQGFYSGVVTQGFWDTLNFKLKQINFKQLDTAQYYGIDGEVAEVIFYWGDQKRHIYKPIDGDPDAVSHTLKWVINSYNQVDLHPLKDNIKFETSYQNMKPPIFENDQVKFPPPSK
jgi:hypothetical protein